MNSARRLIAGVFCLLALTTEPAAVFAIAAETHEVSIQDYRFQPSSLRIKVGDTVRWTNREKRTSHSILFLGSPMLESERMFPEDSWSRQFVAVGSYPYRCGPHPEMEGKIDVVD
jgi:plastocyanin